MAISVQVGRSMVPVGGGTSVECSVGVALAGVMVKWNVVGLDENQAEIAAYGLLNQRFTKTDGDGFAANYYIAPSSDPPTDHKDRVKAEIFV